MADFFSKLGSKLGDNFGDLGSKLSDNLGDLGKIISEKAEVVSKKTEDVVEIQKIKNQIRVMERNNERDLLDIGKMIYEKYQKGASVESEYAELCEAISDREKSIVEYNEQIADLKGKDVCANCKEHVDATATYCPNCGAKMEREEAEVESDMKSEDLEEDLEDIFEDEVEEVPEEDVEVVETVEAEVVEDEIEEE